MSRTEEMPVRGLPVLRSTMRLVSFQLGTLAFASLIVALVSCLYFPSPSAQPCHTRSEVVFPAGCGKVVWGVGRGVGGQ